MTPKKFIALLLVLFLAVPVTSFAALPGASNWEVQTGGTDTFGGGFNPANTNMATDLACTVATTSAPVCTSATYNFIARDVGHYLFVKSGTNWTPGWCPIASVAANAATLSAAAGSCTLYTSYLPSSAAGTATTASPTSGTWTVDYSQSTPIAFTDLVAATSTTFTSVANPIGKSMVGNIVSIVSGTGWNVARWEVSSDTTTTGTAANFSTGTTIATAASIGGTGSLGGPFLTWAQSMVVVGTSNFIFIKTGSYSVSTTVTVPSGINDLANVTPNYVIGYNAVRGDAPQGTSRPTLTTSTSTLVLLTVAGTNWKFSNLQFDGNSNANTAISVTASNPGRGMYFQNIKINSFKTSAVLLGNGGADFTRFEILGGATSCTGSIVGGANGSFYDGYIHASACPGLNTNSASGLGAAFGRVIFANLTTSSGHGALIDSALSDVTFDSCIFYGNAGDGLRINGSYEAVGIRNSVVYGNTGTGINFSTAQGMSFASLNYNGVGGNGTNRTNVAAGKNDVALTGDPFTSGAAGDFSLDNTAGEGAALRAAGYPGVFPGATTTGYNSIGAVEPQATSSSVTVGYPSAQ